MYTNPRSATPGPRPSQSARLPDWSKLSRGDIVRVFRRDGSAATGLVDMLALDRSVLWVIQEGGCGRITICSADRPRIVVVAQAQKAG